MNDRMIDIAIRSLIRRVAADLKDPTSWDVLGVDREQVTAAAAKHGVKLVADFRLCKAADEDGLVGGHDLLVDGMEFTVEVILERDGLESIL